MATNCVKQAHGKDAQHQQFLPDHDCLGYGQLQAGVSATDQCSQTDGIMVENTVVRETFHCKTKRN